MTSILAHAFPFEFCQIPYMWQIGRNGTKANKKAFQLHPFLSMQEEMRVPRLDRVMRLRMKRHLAVPSDTSTCASSQQKSGFLSAGAASPMMFFYVFN